ncbi:MAG: anion permease, partial [Candidatus Omnitrophica bacterium]|nr:anion permease [Candidatus Omnitrophota bacterium]
MIKFYIMDEKYLLHKTFFLIAFIILIVISGIYIGFTSNQIITIASFSLSILGTLLFWHFRLSFAFLGTTIILFTGVAKLDVFLHHASMEIILFLIGMMIIVGFLREIGMFTWMLERALIMRNISAKKFMIALVFSSAILACVVDEVSSILFMIMIILELCDYFEVDPLPFIMISILSTNIGSAGTVIGNPIGVLIAAKAGLTFEDFILYSFPLMLLSLLILIGLFLILFKKELKELDEKIELLGPNEFLVKLLDVPPSKKLRIAFVIFGATIALIACHHRLELLLHLETNTILLIAPLLASAIIMIWRRDRARSYIEKDVEWWTLLFFIFLFAQAGTLAQTGVAQTLAQKLLILAEGNKNLLIGIILFGGAFVSSILDNVVVVAGCIPLLNSLNEALGTDKILWWALLFAACFGGNITVIGSTANIIAVGTLEKQRNMTISFKYWLKIGLIVGVVTLVFVYLCLIT